MSDITLHGGHNKEIIWINNNENSIDVHFYMRTSDETDCRYSLNHYNKVYTTLYS